MPDGEADGEDRQFEEFRRVIAWTERWPGARLSVAGDEFVAAGVRDGLKLEVVGDGREGHGEGQGSEEAVVGWRTLGGGWMHGGTIAERVGQRLGQRMRDELLAVLGCATEANWDSSTVSGEA